MALYKQLFFFFFCPIQHGPPRLYQRQEKESLKRLTNKLTAFSRRCFLSSPFVRERRAGEAAPSRDWPAPWVTLLALCWPTMWEEEGEEAQMNPGGTQRSCLLNPLTCQPISCQASAKGRPGCDLQGHGVAVVRRGVVLTGRDTPALADGGPAGHRPDRGSLFRSDPETLNISISVPVPSTIKAFIFSQTALKTHSESDVLFIKTGDSPVLETVAHKKKKEV